MLALALVAVACAGDAAPPSTVISPSAAPPVSAMTEQMMIETIEENTVGDLDGHRVPMGNMTRGEYDLPDGSQGNGPICSLPIDPDKPGVFVGVGSVVTVGPNRWEVTDVTLDHGDGVGSVTLKRLDG